VNKPSDEPRSLPEIDESVKAQAHIFVVNLGQITIYSPIQAIFCIKAFEILDWQGAGKPASETYKIKVR